ncbi:citramalate synthase [Thermodesulforhabdus norvegica]|uniref:Citramalate synthase n=1 Tax=Thermodesulforhabdus norvegica TaxID=39841 RepID=A0A1I4R6R8_9BACT|nr:citramalate synthase [Thermodesulforhabdus norvegica]SFM47947.1 (R)-citramalate synthase [Thermodesulforhabdus norvegica]
MSVEQKAVVIYDTTLRDGTQGEDFSLSVEDKVRIALKLDEFGIHYIEGGWPDSNPKDKQFFQEIKNYELRNAKIAAFGSTHHPAQSPEKGLRALVEAGTPVITIFGKSWTVHVKEALRISLERNLEIIQNSVAYLRQHVDEVIYDAEHYFDGFKEDRDYALQTLKRAHEAGATTLVLCDTNGGTLPHELAEIIQETRKHFPSATFGIHAHNDSELAVANSLEAVRNGITHVQGTINGIGERCGNANLCSIIPNLCLKMNIPCIPAENLRKLRHVSRYILELANMPPNKYQPFVGRSAFAHKGGVHISAVRRNPRTYEHIDPELVGNKRRFLISDLSGKAAVKMKAEEFGIKLPEDDPVARSILLRIKELEAAGFQFEAAEASLELLIKRLEGESRKYFELLGFRVIDQKEEDGRPPVSEATIQIRVGGQVEHTAALGQGPVNALDNALRKALEKFYPQLKTMELIDYKVRVLPGREGTASKVRVLIESSDGKDTWGTVGVSHDILEASWQALVDSITYKMYKDEKEKSSS